MNYLNRESVSIKKSWNKTFVIHTLKRQYVVALHVSMCLGLKTVNVNLIIF